MKKIYIGIDVGTTSLKALALNEDGECVATAKSSYELRANGCEATQNAEDWYGAAVTAIREIVEKTRNIGEICAISTSAQGGASVLLGKDGETLTPAYSWMDNRAVAEADELKNKFGADLFYSRFGWRMQPNADAAKFLWMKRNIPAVYESAKKLPSTLGFINQRLTGNCVEDPTCAAIRRLYDINKREMSCDVLDYLALSEEKLPETLPTGAFVGNLTAAAAAATGLSESVRVYNGAHDQYCASVGSGIVDAGELLLATGTAWVLFGVTEKPLFGESKISPCIHPAGGYGALSTVTGIGAAFEWLAKLTDTPLVELSAGAAERKGKNDNLFFRPSATGTGLLIGNSLGAHIAGLSIGHDKYDLALALMEGAAFETALVIEEYKKSGMNDVSAITMSGGATASVFWQSLIADVTGLEVFASNQTDSPALGAAIIAMAMDNGNDIASAAKFASAKCSKITPSEYSDYYKAKFERYKKWRKTN
ncbi:MAG: FGGY-family carbohydrate kinase [Clostridia bacterium]|nr:FGGY-family carbohydrate kinase [Clostridia bacterium]